MKHYICTACGLDIWEKDKIHAFFAIIRKRNTTHLKNTNPTTISTVTLFDDFYSRGIIRPKWSIISKLLFTMLTVLGILFILAGIGLFTSLTFITLNLEVSTTIVVGLLLLTLGVYVLYLLYKFIKK